jgi:quinol monooxygenase YgiN
MLVVVVSLIAREGAREELLELVARQAAASLDGEAGCLRFDVAVVNDGSADVVLYEWYWDEAAFEAHRQTRHFARWRLGAERHVEHQVNTYATLVERSVADSGASAVRRAGEQPWIDRGGGVSTIYLVGPDDGSRLVTNGITAFDPGSALPFHSHNCDESVTVLEGDARFEDDSGTYELGAGDTTYVPAGISHRFANHGPSVMRILWTYASATPTRTVTATGVTVSALGPRRA